MSYHVKEIFYTLQGEGANVGRPAVFCRFAGCNLWSGREADRASAVCRFCDTDFIGTDGAQGGKNSSVEALVQAVVDQWPKGMTAHRLVVCTGGEPLLQLDEPLVQGLHSQGFEVAIETNGTLPSPAGVDWICVSPKSPEPLVIASGQELKLVYPQARLEPSAFAGLSFEHFFLQPMDGPLREQNTQRAIDYCLANPQWRLSLQTHKLLGLP